MLLTLRKSYPVSYLFCCLSPHPLRYSKGLASSTQADWHPSSPVQFIGVGKRWRCGICPLGLLASSSLHGESGNSRQNLFFISVAVTTHPVTQFSGAEQSPLLLGSQAVLLSLLNSCRILAKHIQSKEPGSWMNKLVPWPRRTGVDSGCGTRN